MNEPSSKQRLKLTLQIALVMVLCLVTTGLFVLLGAFKGTPKAHRVTLIVESTSGLALITYADAGGEERQGLLVTTPWRRANVNPSGTEVYLTAGNTARSGKIECKLLLDEQPWKTDSAVYPADKVACAGIVP